MDAKTNIKARLPSRHVTERPERAPHRSCCCAVGPAALVVTSGGSTKDALHLPAIAHECSINLDLFDVAEIFKKTPCIADLKSAGRYVAKDMFEAGAVPLLMKTLLGQGYPHGDCMTVTGRTIAENMASVKKNPHQDVVRPADMPITVSGGLGLKGNPARAVTHPGGAKEKQCYADI